MMYKYIKNPNNNKKINIHSKIGKNIIKKYLNFVIGGAFADPAPIPLQDTPNISNTIDYVFNQRSKNITEIYGLVGLDYYKFDSPTGSTKRILLLSDQHVPLVEKIPSDSQEAILYDEFIVYLIQSLSNFGRCVDFYLEMRLILKQGRPLKGGMYRSAIQIPMINICTINTLRQIFKDCSERILDNSCTINKIKDGLKTPTKTKLDNLRFHNIDLRQTFTDDDGDSSLIGKLSNPFNRINDDFYDKFLQFVLEIPGHPTREQIVAMCLTEPNCNQDQINKYITKIELVKKKINKEQEKFKKNNIFNRHIDLNQIIYDFRNSSNFRSPTSTSLKASLVDIYMISRILKNFEIDTEDKRTRGPSKCKGFNKQNNIIVFAGAAHIECFKYVLSQLLPTNSCKYSQINPIKSDRTSKILRIDTSWSFKNFNELMIDFCEELSNYPLNFRNLDNITIRKAVEKYRNNSGSCPSIENWNVSGVTNMSGLFADFSDFNDNISSWNTRNVEDMSYMFKGAESFNQPLEQVNEQWDTQNVINMYGMFEEATSFNQPLNFDTRNVKKMSKMFSYAESFNQPLNFNTGNVTNMSEMFCVAESFNQPLNFDTINVTNMSEMFSFAESFNQPLNFDTQNVTNMSEMFITATSFNQPLNFNTRNVEDMSSMFYEAESFNQPLNFDTRNVANMSRMFQDATSFNQALNFDTSNVTDMSRIFENSHGRLIPKFKN